MAAQELDRLWAYRQPIEAELSALLGIAPADLGIELSEAAEEAFRSLQEYCLRPAKRIRGGLAALAYDVAAGTEHAEPAVRLGAVMELLHAYLLIVDDVMDKSPLRRGEPTIHEMYLGRNAGPQDRHEAEMLAIDIGLIAQHLANMSLLAIDVPAEALMQTSRLLHKNIVITGIGQFEDLRQRPGRVVSEQAVLQKYRQKSSFYTFVNPLQLGFMLAGKADAKLLKAIRAFGEPAGVAFQIRDDYLGIWGDEGKHGKSNLDDIREGKITLLMANAAASKQGKELHAIAGDPAAGNPELAKVREIYNLTGAAAHAQDLMIASGTEAKAALKKQPIGDAGLSKLLTDLVDYVTTRES